MNDITTLCYQRAATALWSPVGEGVLVMDVEIGKYFSMNETASEIWRMLERPITLGKMVEQLRARFDIDADACCAKVTCFVDGLVDRRIVTVLPASESVPTA
jgi:hypothetical protein